jgi:hypothetical protein
MSSASAPEPIADIVHRMTPGCQRLVASAWLFSTIRARASA